MFKRITAAVVCLVLIAASFASCAVKGPKTYREAVAAGREFAESDGLKDITVSAESGKMSTKIRFLEFVLLPMIKYAITALAPSSVLPRTMPLPG